MDGVFGETGEAGGEASSASLHAVRTGDDFMNATTVASFGGVPSVISMISKKDAII